MEPVKEPLDEDAKDQEDLDGTNLNDFECVNSLGSDLGKGSFGVVQKIRRKGTEKIYALKSMHKFEVINGNLIDQVEVEIQVQKNLKHRNVLRLYRHFEDAETVFLLLEFCGKGELYQILRTQKGRRFTENVACDFFCQAAEGLMYLHANNVVHRDIKPENLLVNHENVLKIADFGWCAVSNTLRTTFCGTLDYLAPEMIQARGHDYTLDVWSAGVLLYEMVVGRPPFQSTNHGQLISKILKLELSFPSIVPQTLQDLVRQLLKTEPHERLPLENALRHTWVKMHRGKEITGATAPAVAQTQTEVTVSSPQLVFGGGAAIGTPGTVAPRPQLWGMTQEQGGRRVEEEAIRLSPAIQPGRLLGMNPIRDEEEPAHEPSPVGCIDVNGSGARLVSTEVPVAPVPVAPAPVAPAPTATSVGTPAQATRGVQSPRVPSGPQYLLQPVSHSGPISTTIPAGVFMSPTCTPQVMSRTLPQDLQSAQFNTSVASASSDDELSRTWRLSRLQPRAVPTTSVQPPGIGVERRAPSALRPAGLPETPVQSVVYRPLPTAPSGSRPGPSRDLTSSTANAGSSEVPGTPTTNTREFRSRTRSPTTTQRHVVVNSESKTAEAIRRGYQGGQSSSAPRSAGHSGRQPSQPVVQRDRVRLAPKSSEPLHHALSQNALQMGGAVSSGGARADSLPTVPPASPKIQERQLAPASGGSPMMQERQIRAPLANVPASPVMQMREIRASPGACQPSPKMQARRLSAAHPASVADSISGASAARKVVPMTAAGVLASPYPMSASRDTRLDMREQAAARNPLNISREGDSARCHPHSITEESVDSFVAEGPSARTRAALAPQSAVPQQPRRIPGTTALGSGGLLGRQQAPLAPGFAQAMTSPSPGPGAYRSMVQPSGAQFQYAGSPVMAPRQIAPWQQAQSANMRIGQPRTMGMR